MTGCLWYALVLFVVIPLFAFFFFLLAAFIPAAYLGNIAIAYLLMIAAPLVLLGMGIKSGSGPLVAVGVGCLIVELIVMVTPEGRALSASLCQSILIWF